MIYKGLKILSKFSCHELDCRVLNVKVSNKSEVFFSKRELSWIGFGPKAIPTPVPCESTRFLSQYEDFARRVRIKCHFAGCYEDFSVYPIPVLRIKSSDFVPSKSIPLIESYLSEVKCSFESFFASHVPLLSKCNVSSKALTFIKGFIHRPNVVHKLSDKGGGSVLLNPAQYKNLVYTHLNDCSSYSPVSKVSVVNDLMSIFNSLYTTILKWNTPTPFCASFDNLPFPNVLRDFFLQYLKLDNESLLKNIPKLYVLPKLHKAGSRPIAAGVNFALAPLSQWVGKCLRKVVIKGKRYIESSWDLILKLRNISFPRNALVQLCSGDVFTMYPKVNIMEVYSLLKDKVGFILPEASSKWKKLFCKISNWVLFNNYAQFDGMFWKQISGLPMGSSASPDLCNFYMDSLEYEIENLASHFLFELPIWYRFIDDVFCIHVGDSLFLDTFCMYYNSIRENIKVNFSISPFSVNFLDLTIFVKRSLYGDVSLEWRPFQKPSNAFLYTPHTSFHKKSWKENWIIGNLIVYARNSSRRKYFIQMASKFYRRLRERGFTPLLLNDMFDCVDWGGRGQDAILSPIKFSPFPVCKDVVTPFISVFNPSFVGVPFLKLLTDNCFWREIQNSPFREILGRVLVAHKRERNITDYLTRAIYRSSNFDIFPSTQEDINLLCSIKFIS
jgi:hypothetical protein